MLTLPFWRGDIGDERNLDNIPSLLLQSTSFDSRPTSRVNGRPASRASRVVLFPLTLSRYPIGRT